MRKIAALLAALVPLFAWSQQEGPPPQEPQYAPPPPQQYAPPPQQYAPPPQQYAPPPQQYAPPPEQYPPPPQQGGYAPPPQSPPPGYAPRPKQRGTWYIGFGLGSGDGSFTREAGSLSFKDYFGGKSPTNLSLNFKIGATVTPTLLLGFDITALRSSALFDDLNYGPDTTWAVQINNYDAVATWFPMERGFFLRGGVGFSAMLTSADGSYGSFSKSYGGVNAIGGVGYAFWLLRSFNLTVNLDYSAQSYGSSTDQYAPKSSRFWTLGLGFDWY